MKNYFTLLICFVSGYIFSQNQHALVVHLTDAETGKNVKDAKVTLEGFEITPIIGQYDKKKECYFFNQIPKGYNTVMAYHNNYNEKGYQNLTGLPKQLKIKLYEPFSISYNFEKPSISTDNCCNNGKKTNYVIMPKYLKEAMRSSRKIKKKTFRYLYKEDPNHIAIIMAPNENKKSIKELLDKLFLEEINYSDFGSQNYVLDGEKGCLADGSIAWNQKNPQVMILKKKDGSKYSRFNSIEIRGLREEGLIVACLTNRILEYYGDAYFNAGKFYGGQNFFNSAFTYPRNIDQAFSTTRQEDYSMYFGDGKNNVATDHLPSADDDRMYSIFLVISNDKNDGNGLGILDNMCVDGTKNRMYVFTNSYKLKR